MNGFREVALLLEQRARVLARRIATDDDAGSRLSFLTFLLGQERYAIEADALVEVARPGPISPLPGTPPHVAGLTNFLGEILPVFDLALLFGLPGSVHTLTARLLVAGRERPEAGLLVDAVERVVDLPAGSVQPMLQPPPPGLPAWALRGVTADAIIVLDVNALLDDDRLVAVGDEDARHQPSGEE